MTKFVRTFLAGCLSLSAAQLTVIDSGSTNFPGLTLRMDRTGTQATTEQRDGAKQRVKLSKEMCGQMMKHLKQAGPLSALPASHCMKSASFGSSLFVEYNGERSPDLSCPAQDQRVNALKKDAEALLNEAKSKMKIGYDPIR